MGICGVAVSIVFFLCGVAVNKIPSRGVAVISNRTVCGVRCSVKKDFLRTLCGVVVYCLTHLTDLPLSSICQNLFIFVKSSIITLFWKQSVSRNEFQAISVFVYK